MLESMKAGVIRHTGVRLLWSLPGDQELAARLYSSQAALTEGSLLKFP